jgi:ubiquinone/menaquinone biosynthesis C-methylase UbiE
MTFTLDIDGEGRHNEALNLNPSPVKTLGREKGMPIPRRIVGRAEAIPLPDHSVDRIILERTPLRRDAVDEIIRVIAPHGKIILLHVPYPGLNPHRLARRLIRGRVSVRKVIIGSQMLQETEFCLSSYRHPDRP